MTKRITDEDRLLSELADLARAEEAERASLDERWDRLAAGTLTAEEEAELRSLAESSPEAGDAWEAFRPLGPRFQARIVDRIAAELPGPRKARVLPFPAARIGGWLTAAAAAAAILAVLLRPSAPLPGYEISVTGGASAIRGERIQEPDFAPGDAVEVRLRPGTAFRGRLEARLFLLGDGELRRLDAESEIDGGAVRMNAVLAPDLRPGTWTLWAVVGRPGDLPDPGELQSLAAGDEVRRRDWIAIPKGLRIRPRGP
jgi:hypothetical protein